MSPGAMLQVVQGASVLAGAWMIKSIMEAEEPMAGVTDAVPLAMAQEKFPVCATDGLTTMWDAAAAVVRAPQPVIAVGDLALAGQFLSKFKLRLYLETEDNNEDVIKSQQCSLRMESEALTQTAACQGFAILID